MLLSEKNPPVSEPGTFRVLGERENHYTTETTPFYVFKDTSKNCISCHDWPQIFSKGKDPGSTGKPSGKEAAAPERPWLSVPRLPRGEVPGDPPA